MASLRMLFAISLALVPAGVFAAPGPSMSTLSKIKLALGRDVSAFVPHQSLVKGLWAFYQAGYDYPLAGFAASDNGNLLAIGGSFIDTPAKVHSQKMRRQTFVMRCYRAWISRS